MKTMLLVLLMALGVFLFIFGEQDDSPGAQFLGALMALGGVVGVMRGRS